MLLWDRVNKQVIKPVSYQVDLIHSITPVCVTVFNANFGEILGEYSYSYTSVHSISLEVFLDISC